MSAPDDHFTASPHGAVCSSAVGALVLLVAVQAHGRSSSEIVGRVSATFPAVEAIDIMPTPDDHFTASADCGVIVSARRCAAAVGYPRVVDTSTAIGYFRKPIASTRRLAIEVGTWFSALGQPGFVNGSLGHSVVASFKRSFVLARLLPSCSNGSRLPARSSLSASV